MNLPSSYGEDFAIPCQEHVCGVGDILLMEAHPFILLSLWGQRKHKRFPGTKVVDILIALLPLPPIHGTKRPKHLYKDIQSFSRPSSFLFIFQSFNQFTQFLTLNFVHI